MNSTATAIQRGMLTALPMLIGFIPLGLILGVQASQAGLGVFTTVMMTGCNFAGGSEYAVVGLWSAVPPVALIVITTFLINSRHIIMGATLAPYLKDESPLRVALIYFFMCDETWALNMQEIKRRNKLHESKIFCVPFYFGVGISLYLTWNLSTLTGAVLGSLAGDLASYGFNLAAPATFIALTIALRPKGAGLLKFAPMSAAALISALASIALNPAWSVGLGSLGGLLTAFILSFVPQEKSKSHA